jgi:glutaredoxin
MSKERKLPQLHFQISGFEGCPYFQNAVTTLKTYKKEIHGKTHEIVLTIKKILPEKWTGHLEKQCIVVLPKHKSRAEMHKTSPFIMCNTHFIGGYDQLSVELQKQKPFMKCK